MEIFEAIKFCLLAVFLIGLLTGLFYISRVTFEEHQPIMTKFSTMIDKNISEYKNKDKEIEELNSEISKMREDIKVHKNTTSTVENDLLDTEHLFSKHQDENEKLKKDLNENKRVLKSLKNEYNYYHDAISKENSISLEMKELQNNIGNLENKLSANKEIIVQEKENESNLIKQLKETESLLSDKESKKNELTTKIYLEEQNLKNNKNYKKAIELDGFVSSLVKYRDRLKEIRNGL